MKVSLTHKGGKIFEGKNAQHSIVIDPSVITPLELFALGMISCSGVDIAVMSAQEGFSLVDFEMDANIIRHESYPQKFRCVEIVYRFETDATTQKAHQWVIKSIETYCSTINTLRDSVEMCYTLIINNTLYKEKEPIPSSLQCSDTALQGGCCTL